MKEQDSLEQGIYLTLTKAKEIAIELVNQGMALSSKAPDIKGQVQELADDLLSTSRNNREMLLGLVTSEVDRAVSRMGFVREDELAAVRRHVQRLEKEIAEFRIASAAPVKKAPVKKAAVKKAPAKKAAAQKSGPKKESK
jgi:polyhydroxyalkanoate synthesis regulator phasin